MADEAIKLARGILGFVAEQASNPMVGIVALEEALASLVFLTTVAARGELEEARARMLKQVDEAFDEATRRFRATGMH